MKNKPGLTALAKELSQLAVVYRNVLINKVLSKKNHPLEIAWILGKTVQYRESIDKLYPRVEEKLIRENRIDLKNFPVSDGK